MFARSLAINSLYFQIRRDSSDFSDISDISDFIASFGPFGGTYLVQAKEKSIVFADNEPVVKAFQKMKRGILSHSSRVAAFLIGTGQYNIDFVHTAGKTHFAADFNSRNASSCTQALVSNL